MCGRLLPGGKLRRIKRGAGNLGSGWIMFDRWRKNVVLREQEAERKEQELAQRRHEMAAELSEKIENIDDPQARSLIRIISSRSFALS
jgi:hypothetical protein